MSELRLSPGAYAALVIVAPLPLLAVLALGNPLVLSFLSLNPLLIVGVTSCSAVILALTLRVAMPQYRLAKGSVLLLIPGLLGILMGVLGFSLGRPGMVWASLLLTYVGIVAYLGGGRFAARLTPSVAVLAVLPAFVLLSPGTAYIVARSLVGLAGLLALICLRFRPMRQRGCEYCVGYFERDAMFCDYCGRRLSGLLKIQAPGKRLLGSLASGFILITLTFTGTSNIPSLLSAGLGPASSVLLQIAGNGASSTGGSFGFFAANLQYSLLASALLVFGTVAGVARNADMTNGRKFDNSLGLDEYEVARLASFATKRESTGAELLDSTRFPGGWMPLSLLLEKLARLGLVKREIVVRSGMQTMLWKNCIPS
jgi:hypothetical protein